MPDRHRLEALRALVDLYKATLPAAPLAVPLDLHQVPPAALRTTLALLRVLAAHAARHQLVRQPPVPQTLAAIRVLLVHHAQHGTP